MYIYKHTPTHATVYIAVYIYKVFVLCVCLLAYLCNMELIIENAKQITVTLPKKCDLSKCNNYRTLSLTN